LPEPDLNRLRVQARGDERAASASRTNVVDRDDTARRPGLQRAQGRLDAVDALDLLLDVDPALQEVDARRRQAERLTLAQTRRRRRGAQ